MKRWIALTLICMAATCFSELSLLQKAYAQDVEYSIGTVATVDKAANKITVVEYNWELDEDSNISYLVDPGVVVEGAASWQDLPVGADVDIEYTQDDSGSRTAKRISVYVFED